MFSIRETMADANVLQDFFPTIELAQDIMPDLRRERGEFAWSIYKQIGAVAAQSPRLFIGNLPPASITVVRHIIVTASVSTNLTVDFAVTSPGGGFTGQVSRTDGREAGSGLGQGFTQFGQESSAATGVGAVLKLPIGNTAILYPNLDIIGTDLSVDQRIRNILFSTDGTNTTLSLTLIGYERAIEPSEIRS